jgi:hypothetical protein
MPLFLRLQTKGFKIGVTMVYITEALDLEYEFSVEGKMRYIPKPMQ